MKISFIHFLKNIVFKERFVLVKILEQPVDYEGKQEKVYFYLYESNKKHRCVEIHYSFANEKSTDSWKDWMDEQAKTTHTYCTQVRRWLAGRYDPDIPSYEDIDLEEMKHKLAGSID